MTHHSHFEITCYLQTTSAQPYVSFVKGPQKRLYICQLTIALLFEKWKLPVLDGLAIIFHPTWMIHPGSQYEAN